MTYNFLIAILLIALSQEIASRSSKKLNELDRNNSQHKLIISISQPCSLSVPFLRMMRQRGDFLIVHEPGIYAWILSINPKFVNENRYLYEPKTFSGCSRLLLL